MSNGLAIVPRDTAEAFGLAERAVKSGLFGALKKPEEALVILLMGTELGLGPMQALRSIYVVNGKPVLSADLLVALVKRSPECEKWAVVESTDTRCEIKTKRRGEDGYESCVWTIERAKKAGITGKATWNSYPAQMLKARCAAELARQVYPDVGIAGVYTPDEMESPSQEAPQRVNVEVVQPDDFDPEREAIQADGPTLTERILSCGTLEGLSELSNEARALKKGSPERAEAAAAIKTRRAQIEAAATGADGG
jgi:hypothetical protein